MDWVQLFRSNLYWPPWLPWCMLEIIMSKLIIFGRHNFYLLACAVPVSSKAAVLQRYGNFSSPWWIQPFWSFLLFNLTIPTTILEICLVWLLITLMGGNRADISSIKLFSRLLVCWSSLHSAGDEPNSLGNLVEPINNSVQEHLHGCQFHPHIMPISHHPMNSPTHRYSEMWLICLEVPSYYSQRIQRVSLLVRCCRCCWWSMI